MQAINLPFAGSTENLSYQTFPIPEFGPDEVLIKVHAIGINPVDVKARASDDILDWIFGKTTDIILGWDISGEVIKTGNDVTTVDVGDQVFGLINFIGAGNAYAEYVVASASQIAKQPENVTHLAAAAVPMVTSTAYQALVDKANIQSGDKVLIHAASGGVGHIAVQIAKQLGAYVIGTSSAKNKAFVQSLGADEHIDYTSEALKDRLENIDVILDTVQGQALVDSIDVIKPGGTLITLPGPDVPDTVREKAKAKDVEIQFVLVESSQTTISSIADWLQKEALKPHIDSVYGFSEMAKAHARVESNRTVGKVVIDMLKVA